ncbi:hypothetical protein MTR_3g108300 [Medicago truncatula]|uniref:Uncharacterized protein n=1 Tax=Medicago truncatula TaxID=3880 RepID=G7JC96_MEDTR|nr:hypothetical protein MTR_3g108300 [Medicago truncatula]
MMRYPSQTPPFNGYMPMENEIFSSVGASQYPEFLTQITLGCMTVANEVTPSPEDSTPKSKKNTYAQRWTDFEQPGGSGSSTPQPYSTEVLLAFSNHVRARSEEECAYFWRAITQ